MIGNSQRALHCRKFADGPRNRGAELVAFDHARVHHGMMVRAERDQIGRIVRSAAGLRDDVMDMRNEIKSAESAPMLVSGERERLAPSQRPGPQRSSSSLKLLSSRLASAGKRTKASAEGQFGRHRFKHCTADSARERHALTPRMIWASRNAASIGISALRRAVSPVPHPRRRAREILATILADGRRVFLSTRRRLHAS